MNFESGFNKIKKAGEVIGDTFDTGTKKALGAVFGTMLATNIAAGAEAPINVDTAASDAFGNAKNIKIDKVEGLVSNQGEEYTGTESDLEGAGDAPHEKMQKAFASLDFQRIVEVNEQMKSLGIEADAGVELLVAIANAGLTEAGTVQAALDISGYSIAGVPAQLQGDPFKVVAWCLDQAQKEITTDKSDFTFETGILDGIDGQNGFKGSASKLLEKIKQTGTSTQKMFAAAMLKDILGHYVVTKSEVINKTENNSTASGEPTTYEEARALKAKVKGAEPYAQPTGETGAYVEVQE